MADTLQDLLGQVQTYKAGSDKATQEVLGALAAQSQISAGVANTYTQQATDDVTVQTAKNAADYATQLSRVKAATIAGANLKEQSEVLTGLSSAAADAQTRKDEALAAIAEKDKVGFFDNPIEYITNQFTINSDIAKHNIANSQLESAQNRIMAVNAAAQTTIQTQNAINEPLTAASMEASARTAKVAASVAAANAQIQTLGYNVTGINYALNAKKEEIALGFQGLNAQEAQQRMSISLQQLELSKQEFAQRQKQYAEQDADKHEQQALASSMVDIVKLGRATLLGPNAPPMDDLSGKMLIAALKGKTPLSAQMQAFYDAGERTRLAGTPIIGTTPARAAEIMSTVPVQLPAIQGPIKNIIGQATTDVRGALQGAATGVKQDNPAFIGIDPKNKQSIDAAVNARTQQILDGYAKNVNPADGANPYNIASINQLAQNSPTVAALPIVKKVFAPLMATGMQLTDPKQILSLTGEAVAKGVITHAQALELTTVYHVGVTANVAMRNLPGFGLTPRMSYNATVETAPNAWNPTEVINMADPTAVSRALMKMQADRLQQQFQNNKLNPTPISAYDKKAVSDFWAITPEYRQPDKYLPPEQRKGN